MTGEQKTELVGSRGTEHLKLLTRKDTGDLLYPINFDAIEN